MQKKIKQIAIIGAGSWGTAVGKVIAENHPGIIVKMWAYEKSTVNSINNKKVNSEFLPGVPLPANMWATNNLKDAISNSEALIIATPSKVIPDTVKKVGDLLIEKIPISYLTKGFCKFNNEILTISETIEQIIPDYKGRVVGIYGPSHAEEVTKYFHTCIVVASHSEADRKIFVSLINCDFFQCRESDDIIGVDLGGTLKNPAAIAAGMISVLPKCGDNLEGALIAESLKEMYKLGTALGAKPETIIDIAGAGDLVATALSEHSRNRRFGREVATKILERGTTLSWTDKIYLKFKPEYVLEKISSNFNYLAEGAYAIEPLIELAAKKSIDIPVYRSLYEVLLNKKEPSLLIETIKNPEKFNEIYSYAKLHVKEKKIGLETLKGKAFKKIILESVVDKFTKEDHSTENKNYIITKLKESAKNLKESGKISLGHEFAYISELTLYNYPKFVKKLSALYIDEIIDYNNSFFSNLFLKFSYSKYILNKITGSRNKIKIKGNFSNIKNLKDRVNIIYVARFKNLKDYFYYLFSIYKKELPLPRFYVPSENISGILHKYLIKKSGGFIIDKGRFNNPVYRECVIQYLSTLISHGVNLLYFPEEYPEKNFDISPVDNSFFSILTRVMFKESTEIALVPCQLSYPEKFDENTVRKEFSEPVHVRFSDLFFLSDFTREANAGIDITDVVTESWIADEIILPHHIICALLDRKNHLLKAHKIKKYVERFLSEYPIKFDGSYKDIASRGIKFLLEHKLIQRKGDFWESLNKEAVSQRAEIVKRHLR
ncbi:MAG: NAD(P)H-dependent glycerol-3-phosphate dehydrogenase [Spirochaetes bacterium]|nr:NAD(P)H-dependent glycerol-3-phosphate dehydrogenase [Spirochaetota bacterium]